VRGEDGICEYPATIVVDVANVMGSRPDGWWRDRAGAAVRLHAEIAALAASGRSVLPGESQSPEFVMVLEGAARPAKARIEEAAAGPVRVVLANGSGDDAIVALVREQPGRRFVVTADRELRRRCTAAGADVLGPGWLLGLLRPPETRDQRLSGRPARSTGRPHSPSSPRRAGAPERAS
jgi:8-oxo-dGTP diphosphatase